MALVSVIVPNYNHQNFLAERLDSIFNQTFQDFEVIIFDDASTDDSLIILNEYKSHPKVSHFIVNEVNSGSPFKQWERGLSLANGDYIWIAETDDFADQYFLTHTVSELEKNKSATLCYTDSLIVTEQGIELGLWSTNKNKFFKTQKWSNFHINNGLDEVLGFLLYKVTINNVSAVLFNKSFLKKIDFEKLKQFKNAGDLFTYISLCLQGSICYIPLSLNNYREHTNNFTKKSFANGNIYRERLACFNFVLEYLNENNLNNKEKIPVRKVLNFFMNKNISNLLEFKNKKELDFFIFKCKRQGFVNGFENICYRLALKMYYFELYKFKGISRKLIKKVFSN